MKKLALITQVVGTVTLVLLAAYGLLVLLGGSAPFAVHARDAAPQAPVQAAGAQVWTMPQTMNYQGFLREPDGSLTTGTYTITARIYVSATGGSAVYATTVPNVTVRDGLFNIVLGDDPALPAEAFSAAPRYIGIDLNDGNELIPRQRLHAVPWAMTATTLVPNATIDGLTSNGDIALNGDTTVSGALDVSGDATVSGDAAVSGDVTAAGNIEASSLTINGTAPFIFKKIGGLPDAHWFDNWAGADTGVLSTTHTCAIAGFDAGIGDLQQDGDGGLLAVYPYVKPATGTWWVAAWMRTETAGVSGPDWYVWVMCVPNTLSTRYNYVNQFNYR